MNFNDLSWHEAVAYGLELDCARDATTWEYGDFLSWMRAGEGRPKKGDEELTLSAYSREIDRPRYVLSNLAANSDFYPPAVREKLPGEISWYTYAAARKASGWRPGGDPPTPAQLQHALEFIYHRIDDAPPPKRNPADVLTRMAERLRGMWEKFPENIRDHIADAISLLERSAEEWK